MELVGFGPMNGTGNALHNRIFGTSDNNVLSGLGGNDSLLGLGGNDRLLGGAGNDRLEGSLGHDFLHGGAGNDVLDGLSDNNRMFGGAGNDRLTATSGNNRMDGGAGNDLLDSAFGRDIMIGGNGRDIFHFDSEYVSPRGAYDTVHFQHADFDKIDLRKTYGFWDSTRVNEKFTFIGSKGFSGEEGELRFAGGFLQGDTDGDKVADLQIKIVGSLGVGDILL